MQELEKILKEIDEIKVGFDTECRSECDLFDWSCGACVGECDEYIKERAKDIIRKRMNDGWISVEERLPENNKLVLVWARSTARGADEWSLGSYDNGFWALGSYGGSLVFPSQLEAVAWRPLPEPYRPERCGGE